MGLNSIVTKMTTARSHLNSRFSEEEEGEDLNLWGS